jgi:hypothetical protein
MVFIASGHEDGNDADMLRADATPASRQGVFSSLLKVFK